MKAKLWDLTVDIFFVGLTVYLLSLLSGCSTIDRDRMPFIKGCVYGVASLSHELGGTIDDEFTLFANKKCNDLYEQVLKYDG